MKRALLTTLLTFSATTFAEAADAPGIKIIKERTIDPKLKEKVGEAKAARLSGEAPKAIEFVGPNGKVKKRIVLDEGAESLPDGVIEHNQARLTDEGRLVVVEKRRQDRNERNPYRIRRDKNVQLSWYDEDGKKVGTFKGAGSLRSVSEDGSLTLLVDEGFDPEAFDAYHDVPDLTTTESLKTDPELLDHHIYAVSKVGKVLLNRRIKGPVGGPRNVNVSPNGKWFAYSIEDRVVYLNDTTSGSEERIDTGMQLNWKVDSRGALYGWKLEKDEARREKVNGRTVWRSGRRVFRKYELRPGDSQPVPTQETMEQ